MPLVAAANPPDRRSTALLLLCHFLDTLAFGDCQEDACPLHLKPGPGLAPGNAFENGAIFDINGKFTRFSTTHGTASNAGRNNSY